MASNFPNSIDPFINPVYTKVNGIDYVKAEHVNDLQDAVRNIELMIIGSGLSMNIASNFYVPAISSIKSAVEILDGALKLRQNAFELHLSSVMPTDPFQHHANVLQVTAIGNLNSTRVQSALEELQNDIDHMMSGGFVEGFTLDDRYILKAGPAVITGTLSVQGNITGLQNTTLGTSLSHVVTISGSTTIGKDLTVAQNLEVGGNIIVPNTAKIGAKDFFEYTNIAFLTDGMHLNSFKDFIFTLDSDDATDGAATISKFEVRNGLGAPVFSVNEDGIVSVLAKVAASFAELDSHLIVGGSIQTRLEQNKLEVQNGSFTIKLDSDSNDTSSSFVVTRDGDTGLIDNSTSIILKATETDLIAGNHILRRGVPEVGYFGMKFHSDNAGGKFHGIGVNFKSKMLTTPSSVTLSIDPTKSSNYNNVTITDLNQYGFFVECDALTVGHVELKGTYQTIGN
jgi:hypothetical protein